MITQFEEFYQWWEKAENGMLGEATKKADRKKARMKRTQSKPANAGKTAKKERKKKARVDPAVERAKKQKKKALSLLDVGILRGVVDGDVSTVRKCIDAGSDPNAVNVAGVPLLCNAAKNDHAAVVALLLSRGADAEIREPLNSTREADGSYDSNGATALAIAAESGHWATIDVLIAGGADVAGTSPQGATALHIAAANGQPRAVERLMAHGAPLDARTADGLTALFYAGQTGRTDCCRLLLEAGADAGVVTPWGTAEQRAEKKGHASTAAILRYMPAALFAQKRATRPGNHTTNRSL